MLSKLNDIALSTGSACHDNVKEPSKILIEMNVPKDLALGAIRFSLGKFNTEDEINYVVDEIKRLMEKTK